MLSRRATALGLLTVCGLFTLACPCPPPAPGATFNFEGDCATPTCDFVATVGAIRAVPTLTRGEHGLELDGAAVADRVGELPYQGRDLGMLARCDIPSTLTVSLELVRGTFTETRQVTLSVGTDWAELHGTLTVSSTPDHIQRVTITNGGDQACQLDAVTLAGSLSVCGP